MAVGKEGTECICDGESMVEEKRYNNNLQIIEKWITVRFKCGEVLFQGLR